MRYNSYGIGECGARIAANILSSYRNIAGRRVIKSRNKVDKRRFSASRTADDTDRRAAQGAEADTVKTRRTRAAISKRNIVKCDAAVFKRADAVGHVSHARLDCHNIRNSACTGERTVERYDKRRELYKLDDNLEHVVIQRNDLALCERAELDTNSGFSDKKNSRKIDQDICYRV